MPFMEWNTTFELGVTEFDEHHKHLVHLLNMTYDGIICGAEHDELEAVLDELIDYATYHFAAEEYWMKVHKYPGMLKHCKEHEMFCNKVVGVQNDFHNGKVNIGLEVMDFLLDWLTDHILKTDAEYGHFAKNLPISYGV